MKRCDACGIGFSGDMERCPLCQGELSGTPDAAMFPDNVVRRSGMLALGILAFATVASLIAMLVVEYFHSLPDGIVLTTCLALAVNYLFVRNMLIHRPDFLRVMMRYFLLVLAIAFIWFLVTLDPVVTTFVIPGICMIAVVFDAVLVIIFRGSFVSGYAKYLLFDVVLGIAPLLLVALQLTTWDLPAYASAAIATFLLVALLAFGHRRLTDEIGKLFHM